ncbi:hypothetical protein K2173_003530 [Erythroxylum novogranatense]|uniref:Mediator of RNA polymerase II transcription subunit 13 n=1 Tax=Erythroxylum novogranatense TaxID=1862640 RepID=A0AAV8TC22_9ROSI|nr:hypothetical protein K2173_003530 [Erythroxylum novogranatense]
MQRNHNILNSQYESQLYLATKERHIRTLSSGDIDRVLNCSSKNSSYRLPVIVSPHGMRGWLTGCCPNDLVEQVYFGSGKFRTSNGFVGLSNNVSQGLGYQLRGQSCYVKITLGCPQSDSDKALQSNSNSTVNIPKNHVVESSAIGRSDLKFFFAFILLGKENS